MLSEQELERRWQGLTFTDDFIFSRVMLKKLCLNPTTRNTRRAASQLPSPTGVLGGRQPPSGAGVLAASTQCVASSEGEVLGGARGETSQPLDRFRVEGLSPPKEITLELKVKVCTIKSETPSPVVHSCHDLEQYVQFLQLVEEARATGHENPLKWAIQEAVRRNILRDYLERKGGEVLSILMTEYDYATDMAVLKEEAYEDGLFVGLATGREEGISIGLERGAYEKALETARSMLRNGINISLVVDCTNLPLEIVQQLAKA